MQSELSCALVLVAFMTIELPEHQGLGENKPCSNNTGTTKNTHQGYRHLGHKTQSACVCVYSCDYPLLIIHSNFGHCEGARQAST